ncbi:ribonuclease P protein subunit p38 [Echinops telfairi]|uniref:Ribonuclease P protein subunit p38 n=1 Tax=Echinops telfairi TaxID=9371 RepID=A0ABM0J3R1_ECHTE|nr:ribonuclease P protein subunit p38 [Echinops telfairi]
MSPMAAAPQAPARGSVRKTRPLVVKTSLANPYAVSWSALEREDMHFILQTLEDRLKQIGLQKIEDKKRRKKLPSFKNQSRESCNTDVRVSEELKDDNPQVSGWTCVHTRKQLAIGVNEVTRALEKNDLLLVLVCKSAKPALITSHLIQLSLSRSVPACQVPRLSERIAPVIGLNCVLALGFKKGTTDFENEIKAIIPRVPPLSVPWLPDRIEDLRDNLETESSEGPDKETIDASFENLSSHKRKLVEGQQTPAVILQPLKIKKLIPNPNKVRKPPKSKKTTSK